MMRFPLLPSLAVTMVLLPAGCATTLPPFTEDVRQIVQADGLQTLVLHVATEMDFRSVRALDTAFVEEGPFKKDPHRFLKLAPTDTGRAVAGGKGWIKVYFGKGIFLTFTAQPGDSVYTTPGWGTITIEGERYDILIGVLSGKDVTLCYDSIG